MQRIDFIVPGEPVGKQRPRVYTNGAKTRAVTPQKTKDYETTVRWSFVAQRSKTKAFWYPVKGAVAVSITVYKTVPKSYSKRRRMRALIGNEKPITKPDIDNVVKSILDALNGYAYVDDNQVCELAARKKFTDSDPHVSVTVIAEEEE